MKTISQTEALEKFGIPVRDGEEGEKTLFGAKGLFNWDWKTQNRVDSDSPNNNFFKALDKSLVPFGAQVVRVNFSGDLSMWFIGQRNPNEAKVIDKSMNPIKYKIGNDPKCLDIYQKLIEWAADDQEDWHLEIDQPNNALLIYTHDEQTKVMQLLIQTVRDQKLTNILRAKP